MDHSIFDHVVVARVELRELLPSSQVFEVLALNDGEGLPQIVSLRVLATNSLLAGIDLPPEEWIAQAIERRGASLPNDGNKLNALRAEDLLFDSRYILR